MIYSWIQSVIDSKKLFIYNGINAGQWSTVFDAALATFNKISGLSMRLKPAASRDDANVVLELSAGSSTFSYGGNSDPLVIIPTTGHGRTRLFRNGDNQIEKVFSILPESPTENHINVLKMIAIHEIVHACGLDDKEHSSDGVFMTVPNIQNGKVFSTAKSKKMPPFFFSDKTHAGLKQFWS